MQKIKNNFIALLFITLILTACSRDENKNIVEINGKEIKVEIADTPESRYNGLSDRKSLCENCGMLFKFDNKQTRTFVMRNMNFPIDIIWIGGKEVVGISKNLPPEAEDYKNFYKSPAPVDYALEVNAGFSDEYDIGIGDVINFL